MTVGTKKMPAPAASDVEPLSAQQASEGSSHSGAPAVAEAAGAARVESTVAGTIGVESDESLAVRLRAGDSAAGDELVTRYHPALIRYLHRLAGSDHMAEELHQQTWLSVLDHIERFDRRHRPGDSRHGFFVLRPIRPTTTGGAGGGRKPPPKD